MGWWGQYCYGKPTMAQVRAMIENDTKLTVKSVKFGYAICIYDENCASYKREARPELLNMISIALWKYSNNELLIKEVTESAGPIEVDVPMKYINKPCKAMEGCKFAENWREKVRAFHQRRKKRNKLIKSFKPGSSLKVYGEDYIYIRPAINYKSHFIAEEVETGKRYRIRPMQVTVPE